MSQRTVIAGQRHTHVPGLAPSVTNQGLLALRSNSGAFQRDVFTVSPEVALSGAYRLNDCVAVTLGYSFIYWNHVAQSSDQIDTFFNPTQLTGELTGPARPAFPAHDGGYYVHGLNLGLQWIW